MRILGEVLPGTAQVARLLPRQAAAAAVPVRPSADARRRWAWIRWYQDHGQQLRLTCRHFDISSATFYLWYRRYQQEGAGGLEDRSRRPRQVRQPTWSRDLVQAVREKRQTYPRWGKDKLVVLLREDGWVVSTSMVGRIVACLRRQGLVPDATFRDPCIPRRRLPRPYALRKPASYQIQRPGDLVQVDSADVRPFPGEVYKHFSGRDMVSRWDVVQVYRQATAHTAADFLDQLLVRMPFSVQAIQVDGGSEFKAHFEQACQERGVRLFVLPPRSPRLNGHVERAQRTHKEEFYELVDWPDSLPLLRLALQDHETVYNTIRPHQALGYLTPAAWLRHHEKQQPPGAVRPAQ